MPLDALCLTAVAEELRRAVVGGKIDKIYQPTRDEIVLFLRGQGENLKLLLSANPGHPRAHLTTLNRENPDKPPMFCMLLRKYLLGGRILELNQPPLERILDFKLETIDELGDRVERRLVLEAMGRSANLILLDGEGRILDCIRRIDGDLSKGQRQVLPGLFYRPPAPPAKQNPFLLDEAELAAALDNPMGKEPEKLLMDAFTGLSPLIARELVFRAGGEEGLVRELDKLQKTVNEKDFAPYLLMREGKAADFSFLPILQYGPETESIRQESFSALLDRFYERREAAERVKQRGQDLVKAVTNARDRTARKLANQEKELAATLDREGLRQQGDIITSNLHRMEKGMSVLRAANFYDPEYQEIEIKLDPLLTPQQNAAKYYKDYKKAQKAEEMLAIQLEKNRTELEYLDSVLQMITLSEGDRDLQEIRQELMDNGYLRQHKRKMTAKGKVKIIHAKPMEFRSSAGLTILVGKNNSQNDRLTLKDSDKRDLWFHVQKLHGSHVILKTGGVQPDDQSVTEAAMLAAWFSQAKDSAQVPVDVTPVKVVKKPTGAKPGFVIYNTYNTVYVTPQEDLVKKLRVK